MPVSVAEAKQHLRVQHNEDDQLIGAMIAAAVSHLDGPTGILGRCLVTQTWRQDFSAWPCDGFRLPVPDVHPESVVITYLDSDGAAQTVAAELYETIEDAIGAAVYFHDEFTVPAVKGDRRAPITITFAAGFGAADDVPGAIKSALLLIVGDLYENRENTVIGSVDVKEVPLGVTMLTAPWRRSGA